MEPYTKLLKRIIDWDYFGDAHALQLLIYLMSTVNYEPGFWNGIRVKVGQKVTSIVKLADACQCSKNTIVRALKVLVDSGTIVVESDAKKTIITLKNYAKYQCNNKGTISKIDTLTDTLTDTLNGTLTDHNIRNKEYKEEKNDIDKKKIKKENVADKSAIKKENPIEERAKMLMNKIAEVGLQTYGKEMCREFYDYWTECSDNGKKMRFEKESVFDVKKRLARWNYNAKNKGQQTIVKPGRIEGPGKFSVGGFEVELGEKEYIDEDGNRRYLYECEGKYYDSKAKGWPAVPLTADRRPLPRMIWNAESKHWDSLF